MDSETPGSDSGSDAGADDVEPVPTNESDGSAPDAVQTLPVEPSAERPASTLPERPDTPTRAELATAACERATECGEPVDCVEFREAVEGLWPWCSAEVVPYLECLIVLPTCDPAVDCNAELRAMESACRQAAGAPTIEAACAVEAECDGSSYETCVADYEQLASVLDAVCPGVFGSYVECVASMAGCDVEAECEAEFVALGLCLSG